LARVVLEHPGGPWRRIPRTGDIPNLENAAECLIGHSTACWSFFCSWTTGINEDSHIQIQIKCTF